jgi:hypothetical protein
MNRGNHRVNTTDVLEPRLVVRPYNSESCYWYNLLNLDPTVQRSTSTGKSFGKLRLIIGFRKSFNNNVRDTSGPGDLWYCTIQHFCFDECLVQRWRQVALAWSVQEEDGRQIFCMSPCAAFAFAFACDDEKEEAKEQS